MKQTWKKSIKTILGSLLLCLAATIFIPGIQSEAAAKPSCVKKQTVYLMKSDVLEGEYYLDGTDISSYIFIKNLSSNAKITSVKSSNKKITGESMLKEPDFPSKSVVLNGTGCKPGETSTITMKVKQGGKTYTLNCKITLKLRPSNFKTFSIGGKNYASALAGYSGTGKVAELHIPSGKGTFKIKMKSGIKLTSVRVIHKNKIKNIKNGDKVTFKKGDTIQIGYRYTKKPKNYNFSYNGPELSIPGLYTLQLGGTTVINVV